MAHGDRQLMKKMCLGDKQAFEVLFRKYFKQLTRFAYKYVHSVPVAKDLVQESFLKVWELREDLNANQSIRSYIYNTVRNKALDYKKHQAVKRRNMPHLRLVKESSIKMDDEIFEDPDFVERVQKAVKKLPERAREVYLLHRSEGLTYKEIAEVMGISVKTVETHMTRALKKLRDSLSNYRSGSNTA